MKTKYALLGIVAILGTLNAEDVYKKWERELGNTGGRVYLPEGWNRRTCDDEIEEIRGEQRTADFRAERARQIAAQERIAVERRIQQLERARQIEAQRRSLDSLTRRPVIRP